MRFRTHSRPSPASPASKMRGVTILELVVSVGILFVISSMAITPTTKALKTYQLNDAANQVAGIVKFTRFEAIRRNMPLQCLNTQAGAFTQASLWTDSNGDGAEDPTEKQILLGPAATLVSAGVVPNIPALATSVGVATLTAITPSSDAVKFDQRGAVVAGAPAVYAFYLGNTSPSGGYRAVIVLPSGSVQVWTYTGGATAIWQQIS